MFGDTMQRIYMDGKENLSNSIPNGWEKPEKKMNHRSNKRIIQLANNIRATIDKQKQQPRSDKSEGYVRLFVVPNTVSKDAVEQKVYAQMKDITSDEKWTDASGRKTLVLEHSMAASRLGFVSLNAALSREFPQGFRDGTLPELSFLMNVVYQIAQAKQKREDLAVMKIMKKYSPLLKKEYFAKSTNQKELLASISKEVSELVSLWTNNNQPRCIDVYRKLNKLTLFDLPKSIEEMLSSETEVSSRIQALRIGLGVSFSELISYWNYVQDNTQFSTHQGVKGLEYERVSVIMDDESAGGNLFSYEKLFGAKQLTDTDKNNQKEGKDNAMTRTMRLFYVTCTRAIESLVIIAYTNNTDAVKKTAVSNGWFRDDEVIIMSDEYV
jgi:DNA helicase-2/ATP-dependent DNA helicase PcrA